MSAGKLLAIELNMWERKSEGSEWESHVLPACVNAGEKWKSCRRKPRFSTLFLWNVIENLNDKAMCSVLIKEEKFFQYQDLKI